MYRYDAPTKVALPFNIVGLVAFELFAMHFVETKRGLDFQKPGSQVDVVLVPHPCCIRRRALGLLKG